MVGECMGNVRSTPTPKLTLRTVKVSRTPPPWRRMTAPWKTWTRSRVPSTTRTFTLTVSPGRNSGMSVRRLSRSIVSVGCMGGVLTSLRLCAGRNIVAVPGQVPHVLVAQAAGAHQTFEQVGPPLRRAQERLGAPPGRHSGMVARAQHVGYLPLPEGGGAGVLGVLEQAGREALVGRRVLVAQHLGQQPGHGLNDHQG